MPIPKKQREDMSRDPWYRICALGHVEGHECGGKITWEHCIIFQGKKLQERWAIIPLCERGHAVNNYQDAGTMDKQMNIWVALNMATDEELIEISKVEQYLHTRDYLNTIYGPYRYISPLVGPSEVDFVRR